MAGSSWQGRRQKKERLAVQQGLEIRVRRWDFLRLQDRTGWRVRGEDRNA